MGIVPGPIRALMRALLTGKGSVVTATAASTPAVVTPSYPGDEGKVLVVRGAEAAGWALEADPTLAFAQSESTAAPNATVPVAVLAPTNAATNVDVALAPKGTGALLAQVPDSTLAAGNKRGANATDWQRVRAAADEIASGAQATLAGGASNKASGIASTVGGGRLNRASGNYSTAAGGYSGSAANTCATVGGGDTNFATLANSTVPGGRNASARGNAQLAYASGAFSSYGDAQYGLTVCRRQTTDATLTDLTTMNIAASGPDLNICMMMSAADCHMVTALVTARSTTGLHMGWRIDALVHREAGTVTVIAPLTTTHGSEGAAWSAVLLADTANGGYKIQVTGAAATTIRWVAAIQSVEVY